MADVDDQDLAAVDEAEEDAEKIKDEVDGEGTTEATEVDGDIVEPATGGDTPNSIADANAEPAIEDAEGGCEHCAHKDGCCEGGEDDKPAEPKADEVE